MPNLANRITSSSVRSVLNVLDSAFHNSGIFGMISVSSAFSRIAQINCCWRAAREKSLDA